MGNCLNFGSAAGTAAAVRRQQGSGQFLRVFPVSVSRDPRFQQAGDPYRTRILARDAATIRQFTRGAPGVIGFLTVIQPRRELAAGLEPATC